MRVIGQVIQEKDRFILVRSSRPASCEHCASSAICNKKEVEIRAYNDIGAEVGDWVAVETNEDRGALLIFGYIFLTPIAILFLSYYLYTLFPWLALASIPMLLGYWLILRKINKNHPVKARAVAPAAEPKACSDQK